ncbi:MAG: sulfotransferase, partial [bacterium]
GDTAWVADAQGRAVKVISALLRHLPSGHAYRVVFMRRHLDEVLASQKEMLVRRGEPTDAATDEELKALFEKHLAHIQAWARSQPNVSFLYVSYNALLATPRDEVPKIDAFLGVSLDEEAMLEVVDPALYRQRVDETRRR